MSNAIYNFFLRYTQNFFGEVTLTSEEAEYFRGSSNIPDKNSVLVLRILQSNLIRDILSAFASIFSFLVNTNRTYSEYLEIIDDNDPTKVINNSINAIKKIKSLISYCKREFNILKTKISNAITFSDVADATLNRGWGGIAGLAVIGTGVLVGKAIKNMRRAKTKIKDKRAMMSKDLSKKEGVKKKQLNYLMIKSDLINLVKSGNFIYNYPKVEFLEKNQVDILVEVEKFKALMDNPNTTNISLPEDYFKLRQAVIYFNMILSFIFRLKLDFYLIDFDKLSENPKSYIKEVEINGVDYTEKQNSGKFIITFKDLPSKATSNDFDKLDQDCTACSGVNYPADGLNWKKLEELLNIFNNPKNHKK